jgi:hypothetical protein
LQARVVQNMQRHKGVAWDDVLAALEGDPAALGSLAAMEASGGEPDLIGKAEGAGRFRFCDCSEESPAGRRSICYDGSACEARKENKPQGSAVEGRPRWASGC